jgi:periplasmic divalent cation tolerance protein
MTAAHRVDAARVVLSTHSDAEAARKLAREVVERRLAACVNVLDGATSVYRWKGAVEEAREVLLVIKTSAARLAELERTWLELHPYDVPEWVVIAPEQVEPRYLEWLVDQTR